MCPAGYRLNFALIGIIVLKYLFSCKLLLEVMTGSFKKGKRMPRGRCHFALVLGLQEQLERDLPEVGALNRQYLPDLVAGSMAPDAMRLLGKMGKYGSHFYTEDRRETWGKSVSGMFEAHPDLADYENMDPRDRVLLMGYIAHLTTDEAFRDEVTIYVHGVEDWRPIIYGVVVLCR